MKSVLRFLPLIVVLGLFWSCASPKSPTQGPARFFHATQLAPFVQRVALDFVAKYSQVDLVSTPLPEKDLLDSLAKSADPRILLDRALTSQESLAIRHAGDSLFAYSIARALIYPMISPANPTRSTDSAQLVGFLTGRTEFWPTGKDFIRQPVRLFLPPEGTGAFRVLWDFCGRPAKLVGIPWASDGEVADSVRKLPGALVLWMTEPDQSRMPHRLLHWVNPNSALASEVSVNVKSLQDGAYPLWCDIKFYTTRKTSDANAGFLTYIMSRPGQETAWTFGYLPTAVPVTIHRP